MINLNTNEITETIKMIRDEHLDIRTITMGISLLDCADENPDRACQKIYDKITRCAKDLVETGNIISRRYGIPIIHKRISVTPISLVAAASKTDNYVQFAKTLDKAAKELGVNFIGGYSALVYKGYTESDKKLIKSIPEALSTTEYVCSSVGVATTKAGINMDAVKEMGEIIKQMSDMSKDDDSLGCAKFVVFANPVEDNPFMAGAFHGVGEGDTVINVGVSGPGVVKKALEQVKGEDFGTCLLYTSDAADEL